MTYHKAKLVVMPIEFKIVEEACDSHINLIDRLDILGTPFKVRKKRLLPQGYAALYSHEGGLETRQSCQCHCRLRRLYSHEGGLETLIVPNNGRLEGVSEEKIPVYTEIPVGIANYNLLLLIQSYINGEGHRDVQFLEDEEGQIVRRIAAYDTSSLGGETLAYDILTNKNPINVPMPEVPDKGTLDERLKPVAEVNRGNVPSVFKEAYNRIKQDTLLSIMFSESREELIDDITLTPRQYYELLIGLANDRRNAQKQFSFQHLDTSDKF